MLVAVVYIIPLINYTNAFENDYFNQMDEKGVWPITQILHKHNSGLTEL